MGRNDDLSEVEVEVRRHGDKGLLVRNEATDDEAWINYNIIDDESEIHEKTPIGATGMLVIPEAKAVELGWD